MPSLASMGYLLISAMIYAVYTLFQLHAFRTMAISQLEPLQRSIRVGVMAISSPILLGETTSPAAIIALILAFVGLNMLIDWRLFAQKGGFGSFGKCCIAGLLGGMLTLSDVMGIRASGAPLGYIVWTLLIGTPVIIMAMVYHKKALGDFLQKYRRNIVMMCVCDVLSYGIVLFILYGLQVSHAIPLLNLSILISAAFGVYYFDERLSFRYKGALVLITLSVSAVQII